MSPVTVNVVLDTLVGVPGISVHVFPEQLERTQDVGVHKRGVTRVGDVANTAAHVPVSSVSAANRFAEDGVARNVQTHVHGVIPAQVVKSASYA